VLVSFVVHGSWFVGRRSSVDVRRSTFFRSVRRERRTPNAEPRTPNAERRTEHAERRTSNAERR
jgi:hypothetical protein